MSIPPGPVLSRALYLVENLGLEETDVEARTLTLVENVGLQETDVLARTLYLVANRGVQELDSIARVLYLAETRRDGEVFPWLEKIRPVEQYRLGTVDLYGDGLGEIHEVAADTTVSTSSVLGGNIGTNAIDRTIAEWIGTSGSSSWIRFTFDSPKPVYAIALEQIAGIADWGPPLFRFSDGGPDIAGGGTPERASTATESDEVPVGAARTLYVLPALRTTDYVEVRAQAGVGDGTNRGFREVWIYIDEDEEAEDSSAILNADLPEETEMGLVAWSGRSVGLWPSNGGIPTEPAATVTVPADAVSGLVRVEELT